MSDYPSLQVSKKFHELLKKLPGTGVPGKADVKWLESLGYKSLNDRKIVGALKHIGFADSSGIPTEIWKEFRSGNGAVTLGNAIQVCYAELYRLYPDAHKKSDKELDDFFKTKTNGAHVTIRRYVCTFLAMASLAEFGSLPGNDLESSIESTNNQSTTKFPTTEDPNISTNVGVRKAQGLTINLNVQLTLPESTNAELIDQLFAAMNKHLLSND